MKVREIRVRETYATAVGNQAGQTNQGVDATAIGQQAGSSGQGNFATAMGSDAGQTNQGINAVAIGNSAGKTAQGANGLILSSKGSAINDTSVGHIHIASSVASLDFVSGGWNFTGGSCFGQWVTY